MKIFYLLLSLTLYSCFLMAPHTPTKNELNETMQGAKFNKDVVNNLALYQSLADIIDKNFDTIIRLAESRDNSFNPSAIGRYCYDYDYNSVTQYTNIKDMPDSVYKQVDSLWKQIGENNIIGISICTSREITIGTKFVKMPHNTVIEHVLFWNSTPDKSNNYYDLVRDTLLNKNCIYRLGVSQDYSGW